MDNINSNGKAAFATAVVFAVLASAAVGLRLLTRNYRKVKYEADDWWVVAALVSFYVFIAVMLWGVFNGGGGQNLPSPITHYPALQTYLRSLFIEAPFYIAAITSVRISLLCLYRRIFSVRSFRRVSYVFDGFSFAWFSLAFFASVFNCRPVDHFWNPLEKGSCVNYNKLFLPREIFGTLLDVAILALPIRMVLNLQMSVRTKIILCGVFLLGGFVVITNIVRLIFIYQATGTYISFTQGDIWSNIHAGTAIICACLPTYRPLFPRLAAFSNSVRQRYRNLANSTRRTRSTKSSTEEIPIDLPKSRYTEVADGHKDCSHHTKAVGGTESQEYVVDMGYPLNSIEVRKTVDVV